MSEAYASQARYRNIPRILG